MYSEVFYFLVFINLILFIWSVLSKNSILFFIAVVYTFLLSVLVAGTGIDYHTANIITYNAAGDVNGTSPIFLNVSPVNDKGIWFVQWTASILSFCLIFPAGYWMIKGRKRKAD